MRYGICKLMALLLLLVPVLSGCERRGEDVSALVVNGETVTQSEVRYVMRTEADRYTLRTGNEIVWSETIEGLPAEDYVRELAREALVLARVLREKAEEYDCLPGIEESAWITAAAAADREAAGGDAFDSNLASTGGSPDLYRRYTYETPLLEEKLLERLFFEDGPYAPTDGIMEAYHREEMVCCSYIYLSLMDDDGFRLTGEDFTRLQRVAEALFREAATALAGNGDAGREVFYDMVRAHGQDYAMSVSPSGMTLPKSYHGDAFRAAVDSAAPGEITGVVETQDGFYIILKLEPQADYLQQNREEAENAYRLEHFDRLKAQWLNEAAVEELEGYIDTRMGKR